jgi:hypothetical protein
MLKGLYLSLFLFTVIACGGRTPTSPTPSPTPQSFDGTWTTGGMEDRPIRFVVQGGVVTSFSITFTLPHPGQTSPCTNTHTVSPNVPIANSAFTFSADVRSSSPLGYELFVGPVAGTFTSQSSGTVTIGRAGSTPSDVFDGVYPYVYGVQCGVPVLVAAPDSPVMVGVSRSGS